MKKYFFKSMALVCCLLLQHYGVLAQAVLCPTVVPTGVPTVTGTPGVSLPCGVTCATLSATATPSLNATTSYSVTAVTYAPFSFTAGTNATYFGGTYSDDVYGDVIPLPFNFCYFGSTFSSVVMGSNGNMTFNSALANSYDPWPISGPLPGSGTAQPNAVKNCILAPWQDLYPGGGGTLKWAVYGTAPCRQFVASWNNVPLFVSAPPATNATYQVVLYESTNVIDINIQHRSPYTGWNSGLAVTGICNNTITLFYNPPGENGTTFTANNESWRFTPSGATGGWTYSWTGPTGAAGTGPSVTVCPTVNSTYTVTATSTACSGVTVSSTIPVTVAYVTPITGTTSICMGATSTLANATTPGTWSSSNTAVATIDASGVVTTVSPGTSTISYTLPPPPGGGTPCSATTIFTVNPTPVISGPYSVCNGGTLTMSATPTGGTWVSGNTTVATITSSGGALTGSTIGTTVITYTSPAGCIGYATVNVFSPAPISGAFQVCMGNTTALSNPTAGGTWESSNTTIATIGLTTGVVTGVLNGTSNITYTTPGGCRVYQVITVNPTAPITGVMEVCQFFTIPLSNTLTGGSWTSSNTGVATIGSSTGIVTGVTAGTSNITYTIATTGCRMLTVVTVHPKPVPPTITSPNTYCQFEIPVPMAAIGTSLKWYGPGVTPPMTLAPTPITDVPGLTNYYVTQTTSYGCVSDSAVAPVTVKPKPVAPLTRDTMYCQYYDQAAALTAVGTGLKWYTAGGTLLSAAPVPPTNFVGSTTWYVNQTVNGCTSDKAPLTVTIIFKPDFTIHASDVKVCQFDTLVFSYVGPMMPGAGYHWDLPTGTTVIRGSIYDSVLTVRFDTAWGPHPIFLTASNLNGMCFTTKELDIKVIPQPFAHSFIKRDICLGDTILLALTNRSDNASDFTWLIDGTPLQTNTDVNIITGDWHSGGPYLVSFGTPGNHIITLQASVEGMCPSKIAPDSLRVHDLPNAMFHVISNDPKLCIEDSVQFKADTIGYNYTYAWAPDHSFYNNNQGIIWGRLESERSIIKLTVTDPFGCKATSSLELDPVYCCNVFMPAAFTPNGDHHNDTYFPRFGGDSYHRVHILRITNRWGQTLFQSTDSDPKWDGTYNGVPQDMGVYFYYIKYDCGGKTMEAKGDCTLIK